MIKKAGLLIAFITTTSPLSCVPVRAFSDYFSRGVQAVAEKRYDDALAAFQHALYCNPQAPEVSYNVGYVLKEMGRCAEAIPYYELSRALDPKKENVSFGLAQAYLMLGHYEQAWPLWEHGRTSSSGHVGPRLKSLEDVPGKTILILEEWGMGDMFQFVRYAQFIKERGGRVIVVVRKAQSVILTCCPYIDEVYTHETRQNARYDYIVPLMSLPALFGTTVDTIPANIPYLGADADLVAQWRERLGTDKKMRIGICWQGTGTLPEKDLPLALFSPLGATPGVSLISLQKIGNGSDQVAQASFSVHACDDLDSEHGGFMDTAAIMCNLDGVITMDTSIAHLAGGLGVPVWVMLPYHADWRWLEDREDTPWYPTMRLFRQPEPGDWNSVIERMAKELRAIVAD